MSTSAFIKGWTFQYSALGLLTGNHNGAANAAVLTDTNGGFTVDALIGATIENVTDGSSSTVTDNDAQTVTGVLTGGSEDDWDIDDAYAIYGTFTDFPEVTEVSGLGQTLPLVDVTHFSSDAKEYIAGLADGSEFSMTCNYVLSSAVQTALQNNTTGTLTGQGSTNRFKFTSTNGTDTIVYLFDALNLGYELTPSVESQNQITFNFKITGDISVA